MCVGPPRHVRHVNSIPRSAKPPDITMHVPNSGATTRSISCVVNAAIKSDKVASSARVDGKPIRGSWFSAHHHPLFSSSGVECKDEIYSSSQLSCVKTERASNVPEIVLTPENSQSEKPTTVTAKFIVPFLESPPSTPSPRPKTATSKIFAPRTEDMSKGFLTFSEEEPGLTSKYLRSLLCNSLSTLSGVFLASLSLEFCQAKRGFLENFE